MNGKQLTVLSTVFTFPTVSARHFTKASKHATTHNSLAFHNCTHIVQIHFQKWISYPFPKVDIISDYDRHTMYSLCWVSILTDTRCTLNYSHDHIHNAKSQFISAAQCHWRSYSATKRLQTQQRPRAYYKTKT